MAATPTTNPFEAVKYVGGEPTVDWERSLAGTDNLVEGFRLENDVDVADPFGRDIFESDGELHDGATVEVWEGDRADATRRAAGSGPNQ